MGMLAQIQATFEMPLKAIWLSKVRELLAGRRVSPFAKHPSNFMLVA